MGEPPLPRPGWSVARLVMPLPLVGLVLVQTVLGMAYLEHRFARVESAVDRWQDSKPDYRQQDAARDLALRDDRIAELTRRMAILEGYNDGRRR
jgi:hypothetical protein